MRQRSKPPCFEPPLAMDQQVYLGSFRPLKAYLMRKSLEADFSTQPLLLAARDIISSCQRLWTFKSCDLLSCRSQLRGLLAQVEKFRPMSHHLQQQK